MNEIPDDHPRAKSLRSRHRIIEGMHKHIVAEAGLIAHGRGEAYDYLLGEKTHQFALDSISAAAAMLFLAKHPVISVNGNVIALCHESMVEFSNQTNIPLEINLFYRSPERIKAINEVLQYANAHKVYGVDPENTTEIYEISSQRRVVDSRGIAIADVVFVPLEDGDRTEGLVANGKKVVTVDLNPLSRTSQKSHITIVDNIERVFPLLLESYLDMDESKANSIISEYDNNLNIAKCLEIMSTHWKSAI